MWFEMRKVRIAPILNMQPIETCCLKTHPEMWTVALKKAEGKDTMLYNTFTQSMLRAPKSSVNKVREEVKNMNRRLSQGRREIGRCVLSPTCLPQCYMIVPTPALLTNIARWVEHSWLPLFPPSFQRLSIEGNRKIRYLSLSPSYFPLFPHLSLSSASAVYNKLLLLNRRLTSLTKLIIWRPLNSHSHFLSSFHSFS